MKNNAVRRAFIASLPVMAGYIVLGIGFGMILTSKGYNPLWSGAMSVFIFAGSMQYVAIDLLVSHASFLTIALTTIMVNARHLFYSLAMIDRYREVGSVKPYLIFSLTDETYSLLCTEDKNEPGFRTYCFCVSLFDQCYWITGSMIGAIVGSLISINTTGMDFALTALFITICVDQWKSNQNHLPALIGFFSTLVCLFIFGTESFLIPSMIVIMALLFATRSKQEAAHE